MDTIVPTISFINVPAGSDYGVSKSIRVEVRDEMSGITDYRCTIDGTWALFEYDAKNNVLIGDFKRMPFLTKGKHVLEVSVTDANVITSYSIHYTKLYETTTKSLFTQIKLKLTIGKHRIKKLRHKFFQLT